MTLLSRGLVQKNRSFDELVLKTLMLAVTCKPKPFICDHVIELLTLKQPVNLANLSLHAK